MFRNGWFGKLSLYSGSFFALGGVHTYCTVGNFGSDQRLEYTVLGGPVNLAARLQTAADPDTILASESTWVLIQDIARGEHVRDITPKGFVRPVPVYRLDGLKSGAVGPTAMIRRGKHVEVNIIDDRHIREAIEELKRIQEEFEACLSDQG